MTVVRLPGSRADSWLSALLVDIHQTSQRNQLHSERSQKRFVRITTLLLLVWAFHPDCQKKDIEFMPKRYVYKSCGNTCLKLVLGLDMMLKRTCTIQANLDFASAKPIWCKSFVCLWHCKPIATVGLFANSPFKNGKPNDICPIVHILTDTW